MNIDKRCDGAVSTLESEITGGAVEKWFASEDTRPGSLPKNVDIVQRYSNAQLRIVNNTTDLSLHNLHQSPSDSAYTLLRPPCQRRRRWDIIRRAQLIEPLLFNIPIPRFFYVRMNTVSMKPWCFAWMKCIVTHHS